MSASTNSSQPPSFQIQEAPSRVAVLIACPRAMPSLEEMIERLAAAGVPAILMVDDGNSGEEQKLFDRLALQPSVHLLRHRRRQGRGAALKTGMAYFEAHLSHYVGLVTADCNHPQSHDDILRVARALNKSPRLAILGARCFEDIRHEGEPPRMTWRARTGNRAAAFLFRTLTGIPLSDAQTGLRGLPASLIPRLLTLPGRGYDFEMQMLLDIARSGHPLAEQPIRLLGRDFCGDSQFRPVHDSWRVLCALFAAPQKYSAGADVVPLAQAYRDKTPARRVRGVGVR